MGIEPLPTGTLSGIRNGRARSGSRKRSTITERWASVNASIAPKAKMPARKSMSRDSDRPKPITAASAIVTYGVERRPSSRDRTLGIWRWVPSEYASRPMPSIWPLTACTRTMRAGEPDHVAGGLGQPGRLEGRHHAQHRRIEVGGAQGGPVGAHRHGHQRDHRHRHVEHEHGGRAHQRDPAQLGPAQLHVGRQAGGGLDARAGHRADDHREHQVVQLGQGAQVDRVGDRPPRRRAGSRRSPGCRRRPRG